MFWWNHSSFKGNQWPTTWISCRKILIQLCEEFWLIGLSRLVSWLQHYVNFDTWVHMMSFVYCLSIKMWLNYRILTIRWIATIHHHALDIVTFEIHNLWLLSEMAIKLWLWVCWRFLVSPFRFLRNTSWFQTHFTWPWTSLIGISQQGSFRSKGSSCLVLLACWLHRKYQTLHLLMLLFELWTEDIKTFKNDKNLTMTLS